MSSHQAWQDSLFSDGAPLKQAFGVGCMLVLMTCLQIPIGICYRRCDCLPIRGAAPTLSSSKHLSLDGNALYSKLHQLLPDQVVEHRRCVIDKFCNNCCKMTSDVAKALCWVARNHCIKLLARRLSQSLKAQAQGYSMTVL